MRERLRGLPDVWFAVGAGLLCAAWAFLAWLTVIPNQDLLADGIQVQSVLLHPHVVLSFPGQKHGGVLEYPFNILAEWVAPANYWLHSSLRIVFAFLTGFFAARLYRSLFPTGPRWSFVAAVAVGPTILHGLAGPAGNTVGVWWLNANYDLSWLLVILGFWIVSRTLRVHLTDGGDLWRLALGGLAIGLGFYQQPTIGMLIVALTVLTFLRVSVGLRPTLLVMAGAVIGVIPAAVSYVVNAKVNTWDPSHFPAFVPKVALASLGLDGMPTYFNALLPYALGLAPSDHLLPGSLQSMITALFIFAMFVCAVVGSVRAWRHRVRPSAGTAIALTWVAAVGAIVAFGFVVDPVWFYSAGLAVLLWMSVGLLPTIVRPPVLGVAIAWAVVVLIALSTVTHNAEWYRELPGRITAKATYNDDIRLLADRLHAAGVRYVYGSYYDALPVGYGSAARIRAITNTYNRFPITAEEAAANPQVIAAVNLTPTDDWGTTSLARVKSECVDKGIQVAGLGGDFGVFSCPITSLRSDR